MCRCTCKTDMSSLFCQIRNLQGSGDGARMEVARGARHRRLAADAAADTRCGGPRRLLPRLRGDAADAAVSHCEPVIFVVPLYLYAGCGDGPCRFLPRLQRDAADAAMSSKNAARVSALYISMALPEAGQLMSRHDVQGAGGQKGSRGGRVALGALTFSFCRWRHCIPDCAHRKV